METEEKNGATGSCIYVYTLLDYDTYYNGNFNKSTSDIIDLINGIPSETLLYYLATFQMKIYSHDNDDLTGKIQFSLVDSLLGKCHKCDRETWTKSIKRLYDDGKVPILFYNYSNLLFYDIVFSNYNTQQCRDLTSQEAKNFFDAYLIINSITTSKISFNPTMFNDAITSNSIERFSIPFFIWQKDYQSGLDLSVQFNRGVDFFKFLESNFDNELKRFYQDYNINSYSDLFLSLSELIYKSNLQDYQSSNQLVELNNNNYLNSLCINSEISNYISDKTSFSPIRSHPLYKINNKYLILDVNFLFNLFYKSQVFTFSRYRQATGDQNFLSYKGKHFTEELYLPKLLDYSFPKYIKFYNSKCIDSSNEELCDAYLRDNNKICLIELKDITFKANIKNQGNAKELFDEFDLKFIKNERGKQKGISQLLNAVEDIETKGLLFDSPPDNLVIFPVIVYTDNCFGIEGLNKYYKEIFRSKLSAFNFNTILVKDIIFINLNFFEYFEEYFNSNRLDFFDMLENYNANNNIANFETICGDYFSKKSLPSLPSKRMEENFKELNFKFHL